MNEAILGKLVDYWMFVSYIANTFLFVLLYHKETLIRNANMFGLSIFGDGATIKKTPMINIMCAGVHNPAAVLDVVDTTGKKKDSFYLAGLFLKQVDVLETKFKLKYPGAHGIVDLAIFDGAQSIQNAGVLMGRHYKK